MNKTACTLIVSVCLVACSAPTPKITESKPTTRESEANLTQTEAEHRGRALGAIAYRFEVRLTGEQETFEATTTVDFELKAVLSDLFLDLRQSARITKFMVNGAELKPTFAHHRLALPAVSLKPGANRAEISYVQNFAHDGRGFHRFTDPEDGNVYLYTQFEAYDAHQMFPCFDQPDLKATMTMKVIAPSAWNLITTTRETSVKSEGAHKVWDFPTTPKLSTYVFSLHAGPYHKWEDQAGPIPLRLFARESLAKYIVARDWFVPTRQGLKFYGDYFHHPYPFKKYDQVIAPDFNSGAMENVAAVTFSEDYIKRGSPTRQDREHIASVILHEMAHMWFGDLVTMRWWNGLWLNESFATFMSSLAGAEASEFKEAWISFYRHDKQWAYIEDQLVITHPIETLTADVATAFSNFDAITYGKGASVLKQLNFYLGADKFRDGVRGYFREHAYQNTSLAEFIGALETSSKRNLQAWSKAWLEGPGLDSLEAVVSCANEKLTSLKLRASGPDGQPTPRVHKTRVRFYDANLRPGRVADIEYAQGNTEVTAFNGSACPALIDTNDEDHDYVKLVYDPRSLATLQRDAMKLSDRFTRLRVWPNLMQMVRDQKLAPAEYLGIATRALSQEKEILSAGQIMDPLSQVIYYLPTSTAAQKSARAAWVARLEDVLWSKTTAAAGGSDAQKIFLDKYIAVSESAPARENLVGLLHAKLKLPKFFPDADRRWAMIVRLAQLGDTRAETLIDAEKNVDTSERGLQFAMASEAAVPDVARKQEWFDQILTSSNLNYARARTVARTFLPGIQDDLRAKLSEAYYAKLPAFARGPNFEIIELFVERFAPAVCTRESADKLAAFLKAHADLPPTVIKDLKREQQEDARCAAIRG